MQRKTPLWRSTSRIQAIRVFVFVVSEGVVPHQISSQFFQPTDLRGGASELRLFRDQHGTAGHSYLLEMAVGGHPAAHGARPVGQKEPIPRAGCQPIMLW